MIEKDIKIGQRWMRNDTRVIKTVSGINVVNVDLNDLDIYISGVNMRVDDLKEAESRKSLEKTLVTLKVGDGVNKISADVLLSDYTLLD